MTHVDAGPRAPEQEHTHREHEVERADPFYWLKDKHSKQSVSYLQAERDFYDVSMSPLNPLIEQLRAEMLSRVAPREESARWREGAFEYFTRSPEGSEYEQLWRIDPKGVEQLLLDENELLGGSTFVAVGLRQVSPDGRMLAYSVDLAGEEVFELRFRNLDTGVDLAETAPRSYYGGAWSADSSTFFYTVHDDLYRPFEVWRHVIGTSTKNDQLVFSEDDPQFDVLVSNDRAGAHIVIETANRNTSETWLVPSDSPDTAPSVFAARRPGVEYSVAHLPAPGNHSFVIVTNDGATDFRVMRTPVESTDAEQWTELLAEQPGERIHAVDVFAGYVVLSTVRNGRQLLRVLPWEQLDALEPLADRRYVESGVAGGLLTLGRNEHFDTDDLLIEVQSSIEPLVWERVSLQTGDRVRVKAKEVPNYRPADYVLEERKLPASDGVEIPVKLVRRRDTALDGTAPLLLYGYGAYESSFWPGFECSLASLLDRGVVFAHAGIRGGAEMGRRWWLDGRLLSKRNSFTDFIDVADALANQRLIDGDRIVSRGLSAGGLLQGAVYSMRPERWRAVVAEVPFVDVLTTMFDLNVPLSANELDEWGDPRRRADFDYLHSYSPYENVPTGPRPHLLVTGALHDPRVMVHEPAKWVARLRASDDGTGGRTLFRAELGDGGHTGPVGRFAHLGYEAEVAAFILDAMRV